MSELGHGVTWDRRARLRGEQSALVSLDLDDFTSINDRLGHTEGDQMLKIVAERLRSATLLRNADLAMYRAKQTGKGRHTIYHPSMPSPSDIRLPE